MTINTMIINYMLVVSLIHLVFAIPPSHSLRREALVPREVVAMVSIEHLQLRHQCSLFPDEIQEELERQSACSEEGSHNLVYTSGVVG